MLFRRRRCLSSLIFRNEDKNLVHQTLSANHAGKMFDACEEQISGDMTQNIGRHDYKFRATWLWFRATWRGARCLSGDLTLNPCTAPGKCCSHWLCRSSWINRLRSWPVQLCSLVSMMACTFICSTFKSFSFDLMSWQYR